MAIDYPTLATEIRTDPNGYGYAAPLAAGSDNVLAGMLNLSRPAITIRRPDITPGEVLEAIDSRDFVPTPSPAHVAWFESATQLPFLRLSATDGTPTRVLGNIRRLLETADAQQSRVRLDAVANRSGSRAEQLFGPGISVTSDDVARALRPPT